MRIKTRKITQILALISFFAALTPGFYALAAPTLLGRSPDQNVGAENFPLTTAADKVVPSKTLAAGFYQFNNLEIFKSPAVDEPPTTIEVIQRNEKSCFVYENGKNDRPLSCVFVGEQNNIFLVQVDERTTLLGLNQEPALLSDFVAGERVNVLGWLAADGKTIRAAVLRNIEDKSFHQSLSGTIQKVTGDGFVLVLENGDEILVKTPIVEGAQVTVKGVFDKINNTINSVLSILIRPTIIILEKPVADPETPPATPSARPSTLFKNFLRVFGL
ncbi:MAG: hypothetical protein UU14_C0055G0003 [Candidatus Roizmanbacteria bacterium GW2011_GWB1_40_7]|uniref:DUF5666 domain-containing protein n=1 Tax=Candidatus Roizmanbacteria bacterium GW2011_GWB1_40_7 TaxID=1618482 RepID=A0A0G0T657_9BACT|nr:MAG: hypothetical protein UU14_C0055G0003 [Candidatus Roizmanbacteria bacterium GW2011_GWB1_40_7]